NNNCISFDFEYRFKNFGLRMPVRLPTNRLELEAVSFDYFGYNYVMLNTNYEIGVLPVFYFSVFGEIIQPYILFGAYFGNSSGYMVETIRNYELDPTYNTNIQYISGSSSTLEMEGSNYIRYSLGSGAKLKLTDRFGIAGDISFFIGGLGNRSERIISNYNYNSTDNSYYTNEYTYNIVRMNIQTNLSLTYQIF
ncbi:MAG: hypothetical protein HRT57_15540, partial [Crocinitomicaceae bacterium]|nr:hypothetical protein [Crocinitomicaceae bacterium]